MSARPNTPDRVNPDGSRSITTKRACNGCGDLIGDITDAEMQAAIGGRALPDVRRECPTCAPTAPEPACARMQIASGEVHCLIGDCDHDRWHVDGEGYCDETRTEDVCGTHSKFTPSPEEDYEVVTHAEPWPCRATTEAA